MRKWEELPEAMRKECIRPYYDRLVLHRRELKIKRALDVAMASLLLGMFSPVLILIAIAIKKDSEGPVFFQQKRVTQYGKCFRILKFRTMVQDAEKLGSQVTVSGDARVTGVGKVLRKFRLDELPQLVNVLKGDMSFVGTRPEVVKYVRCYTEEMLATLLLPAGITSRASICYKDEEQLLDSAEDVDDVYIHQVLPGKMRYNLEDIRSFSLGRELLTMIQTVFAVLK